jgi:hypothetical protein
MISGDARNPDAERRKGGFENSIYTIPRDHSLIGYSFAKNQKHFHCNNDAIMRFTQVLSVAIGF